jgi:hypothetical protein
MDKDFANKLTAFLAAMIGLFAFLNQIFPSLQEGINQIGAVLIVIVPVEYQGIVKIVLVGLGVIVAIIVYVYNYTTSKALAREKLYTPIPKDVLFEENVIVDEP